MTATVHLLPSALRRSYTMRADVDIDGVPLWYVESSDGAGLVQEQWLFLARRAAEQFLARRRLLNLRALAGGGAGGRAA